MKSLSVFILLFCTLFNNFIISKAYAELENYKEFNIHICNINKIISDKYQRPIPVESLNFHQRLYSIVKNLIDDNSFKANLVDSCGYDGVSKSPILLVRHGYIKDLDGDDVFKVTVSAGPDYLIDGLPVNIEVDGKSHFTELRIARTDYADVSFINPTEINNKRSGSLSLEAKDDAKTVLFNKKLIFAGALLSGRSAWPVADVALQELLTVYESTKNEPLDNDTLILYTEFLTYKSFEYLSRRAKGLNVDVDIFKKMIKVNPIAPTPIHILLYESILARGEKITFSDFREIVEASKLPEIGFKFESPFENLVLEVAGFKR